MSDTSDDMEAGSFQYDAYQNKQNKMEQEKQEAVFVAGLYLNRVPDAAPSFIITNQSIHVDTLIKWLQEHKDLADEKGYLKLVGKESKNKDDKGNFKRYFQVDTWKPTEKADVMPQYPEEEINPDDIPF